MRLPNRISRVLATFATPVRTSITHYYGDVACPPVQDGRTEC
jgi:hypothetical protein